MNHMKLAIIGGGASGLIAAITAANQGAEVTIFEKNDRIGKKILATGNGKCNITNLYQDIQCYHSGNLDFVMEVLNQFPVTETISFFETLGLILKNKNGYIYPYSEQASTVLDLLRMETYYQRVKVELQTQVQDIQNENQQFILTFDNDSKSKGSFDSVILCTGSMAGMKGTTTNNGYEILKKMGHTIINPYPCLVQLKGTENFYKAISGVRCSAKVSVEINQKIVAEEVGELQLTDQGISGIVVFQISSYVTKALAEHKKVWVHIDFLPDMDLEDYKQFYKIRLLSQGYKTAEEFFTGLLNKKIILLLLKLAGLKPEDVLTMENESCFIQVFQMMKDFRIQIHSSGGFEQSQVSGGGVCFDDFYNTLESKFIPGFYCCGEVMDVDGICGGYNLQWAWASGYVAGLNAVKKGISRDTN